MLGQRSKVEALGRTMMNLNWISACASFRIRTAIHPGNNLIVGGGGGTHFDRTGQGNQKKRPVILFCLERAGEFRIIRAVLELLPPKGRA